MIFERVAPILAEHFNVPEEDISEEMTFEELVPTKSTFDLATILRTNSTSKSMRMKSKI